MLSSRNPYMRAEEYALVRGSFELIVFFLGGGRGVMHGASGCCRAVVLSSSFGVFSKQTLAKGRYLRTFLRWSGGAQHHISKYT
eukprot:5967781-Amphidinium_carterae.1